ncbi:hypothetical protein [Mycolicibacter heraklionensis]|uniref:hypothetical protein n=1 Tax=Mycolicibacter heraklionensis TaxID=512402 RepID=UPI0009EED2DE|nr:hypothetical protein [Mycolicibacter heraklionensis]
MIVINKGAEAVTVANVGVKSEDGSYNIDVQYRRDQGAKIDGPDFPAAIDGHGAARWTIGKELVREIPHATQVVGYAQRYKSIRKYPKRCGNPLKLYVTPTSQFKN